MQNVPHKASAYVQAAHRMRRKSAAQCPSCSGLDEALHHHDKLEHGSLARAALGQLLNKSANIATVSASWCILQQPYDIHILVRLQGLVNICIHRG
jgi:hypothetical protein